MGLWSYFNSEKNRKRLAFFAVGGAAAIAGLWQVFVHFNPAQPIQNSAAPPPVVIAPNVSATNGSVAIGGNVSGSSIVAPNLANPVSTPEKVQEVKPATPVKSKGK
ncbi:hypothetical protein [Methylosinus sporium]|uniref:hypothetical protein n=1 Tax=Methylosinus sporium TaxID=428 RepID=UPI00383B94C3